MCARRSSKLILWVVLALACSTAGAELLADYRFEGDLSSSVGSPPDLEYLGSAPAFSTVSAGADSLSVLEIELGSGLRLGGVAGLAATEYSIALDIRLGRNSSYQKLVDFRNRVSDTGLYLFDDFPFFFGVSPDPRYATARQVANDEFVQVVLTREAAGELTRVFVNGLEQFRFVDDSDAATVGPDDVLHFLVDDTRFSSSENPEGQIDRLRVWSTALADAEIAALAPARGSAGALVSKLADYTFDGSLASSVGVLPDLEYLGGVPTFSSGELLFEMNTGLRLLADAPGALPGETYTIALELSLTDIDGRRKLVDFAGRLVDEGIYLVDGFPVFDGETPLDGLPTIAEGAASRVVVTRAAASKRVNIYVDEVLRSSFIDDADGAVIDMDGELFFLADDTFGAGIESPAGSIDRLRLWDGALTPDQVRGMDGGPLVFTNGFEATVGED